MKKILFLFMLITSLFLLFSCSLQNNQTISEKIDKKQLVSLINNERSDLLIIDVRTYAEFTNGNIENSINIDINKGNKYFLENVSNIVKSKTMPIVVYCRSGNRSKKALGLLKNDGYQRVYDFGSYSNWIQ